MQGRYELELGGVKRVLNFNNFAHVQLSKAIFEKGHFVSSPDELIDKLLDMSVDNVALFMKAIVYAGLVGNDYLVGFKPSMTQEEVGMLIADLGQDDLLSIWEVFMNAMGSDLAKALKQIDPIVEDDGVEKKS